MWKKIKNNTAFRRIVSFLTAFCMMVGLLQGLEKLNLFEGTINASAAPGLENGNYIFLDASINWKDAGAVMWIYCFGSGGEKWYKMTQISGTNMWYVQINSYMKEGIIFVRGNSSTKNFADSEMSWGYKWNQTKNLSFSSFGSSPNGNTYTITGWDNSGNFSSDWNYSYKNNTMYFYSYDESQTTVTAKFYSSRSPSAEAPVAMTKTGNLYSCTIPAAANSDKYPYDKVCFMNASNQELCNADIIKYDPNTNNTYYYQNTKYSGGTFKSVGWSTHPVSGAISEKELYFSNTNFPVESGNHLYINGTEVPLTVNDTESGNVYSYTYSGSQDAIFKFVNSSGTEYRFLWSETGKNLVTVDSNDVASVSGKFNAPYHYIYFSTEIVPQWNDADSISWLRYLDSTNTIEPRDKGGYQNNDGTLGWTKMTRVYDHDTGVTYWQVKLLSAIEDASGIQFVRGTLYSSGLSDGGMFWDRVRGSSTRTIYSYSSVIDNNAMTENMNMYTINKNGDDFTNQGGTLSKLGNGGEYLYFYNMNPGNSNVVAHFISFDGVTDKIVDPMSVNNGLYTYVIPSEQAYKYVEFYVDGQPINATDNRYNIMLNDGTSQDGRYDPTTNNTYYYRNVSNGSNDTLASQGWFTHPKTGTITGKTLYFSNIDFPVGSGDKLYIGGAEVSLTVVDSNTYSYVYTGSQDAMFRFVYSTGEVYNFLWHDASSELVSIDGDIAVVGGSYVQGDIRTVYYDASYSKQEYGGADGSNGKGTTGQYSIPNASGIIRYYATAPGTSYAPRSGSMKKVAETTSTDGVHTYSDLYKCVLPEVYTHIIFSSFELSSESDVGTSGNRTQYMEIPSGYSNPCFYADTSDPYVFYSDKFRLNGSTVDNLRSGVWKEAFDGIRTTVTDPVDIPHKTEVRENSESKLYQTVTLYDYYTDYELNGMNRDDIEDITYSPTPPNRDSIGNHRTYQPFRQFNAALSSYFEENNIKNPIYWGNFQHYAGSNFGAIADTINLFGMMNRKDFYYLNNASWASGYFDGYAGFDPDYAGRITHDGSFSSSNATQGIVDDALIGGNMMMEDASGTDVYIAPFFDKEFLEGDNSKNAQIGKVYENVTFPFKKRLMKSKSKDDLNGEVEYWYFDSKETNDGNPKTDANEYLDSGLQLYQDSATGSYFLDESRSVKVSGAPQFLPFNDHSQGSSSDNRLDRLNYGFGMRIEIKFRLTEDGMIRTDSATEEYAPIEFRFEGDDDVWVYVDGNLALDIGGQHGIVTGYLDFSGDTSTKKAYVDYVKDGSEVNISESASTTNFSMKGNNTDEHTLVMYYMERGLFESNLYMSFNFLSANTLEVEKEVDTSDVNPIFTNNTVEIADIAGTQNIDVFDQYRSKDFTFGIKNFATHFPEKISQVNNEAFDIKQYEIRSYGSVGEGGLVYPVGADYARNYKSTVAGDTNKVKKWICSDCRNIVYQTEKPTACSQCSHTGSSLFHEEIMQIGANGEFTVKDGESVEFVDQFRRGSYLYLEEKDTFSENPYLFRTKWTMYENGYKVLSLNEDSSAPDKTVTNAGSYPNGLVDIESRYVNDGRIESYLTGVSGITPIENRGYTTAARPSADSVFVFRSYEDPGRVNGSTTLKALYTNSVNVDTLKIGKSNIYDEDAGRLNGVYTFNVEFSNVGDEFLERMWKCSVCEAIVNSKTAPIECSDCGASGTGCHFDLIYRHVCSECGTTVLGTESQKPATCSSCGASGDKIQRKDYAIVITRTIDLSNADTSDDSFSIEGIPIGTHFKVVEANVSDNSYLVDVIDEESNVQSNGGNSYSSVMEHKTQRVWKCSHCGSIEEQENQPTACSDCEQNEPFEDVTYSFIFRNALKTEIPVEKVWKDESGNDVDNGIKQPVSFVLQKKNRNTGNWQTLVYNSQTKSYSPFEFDEIYGIYNSSLTDYESYVKRSSTTGEYSRVSYDSGTDSYVPDASTPLNLKTVKLGSIDISDRLTYYYEYNSTTGEWEKYRYSEDTHTWVKNSDRTVVYTLKSSATASENWKRTLSDIPKYEKITDSTWDLCQYRILELDNVTGRVIEPGDTVTLKYDSIADKTFEVTYKNYWVCDECETENAYNFSGGNTCSNTGYVHTNPDHDGYFSARITNTISNKTSISIIKVDAADTSRTLSNVKFKIEKVSADGSTVDTTYHAYECDVCGHISFGYNTPDQCVSCNAQSSHMSVINGYVREEVTDSVGRLRFNDLPDGIYRITETSTQDGYSLLTSPIYIKINKQTDTYGIYNITTQSIEAGGTLTLENNTITITVKNRAAFRFPDTGGNGKTILGLIGLFLIWMSGMIYIKRKIKESGHIKHG